MCVNFMDPRLRDREFFGFLVIVNRKKTHTKNGDFWREKLLNRL